ncbi:MAG: hypothetical protein HY238_25810 [Acidobacteria bacterium]|nr:hypothetical protein [Acidobacteriota bacterium]
MEDTSHPRGPVWASLAAVASLVAGLSCCLPLGPLLGAAGLAGVAPFLGAWRPYLAWASVALLGLAFFQTYGARQCRARRSVFSVVLLWTAAGLTVILFCFPQVIAGWVADR